MTRNETEENMYLFNLIRSAAERIVHCNGDLVVVYDDKERLVALRRARRILEYAESAIAFIDDNESGFGVGIELPGHTHGND